MALAGCKPKPEIQTYQAPKEESAPRPGMAAADPAVSPATPAGGAMPAGGSPAMTATPAMTAQVSGFQTPQWQAPAGWLAKDLGSVRKGSWDIMGEGGATADMSVTVFPGDVGGDLANVNRWRQQLSLPPVDQTQLGQILQHVDLAGGHAHVVFLESPNGQAIHGAILPVANATWFFKMQGDAAVVSQQREAFGQFLQTVDFSAAQ